MSVGPARLPHRPGEGMIKTRLADLVERGGHLPHRPGEGMIKTESVCRQDADRPYHIAPVRA